MSVIERFAPSPTGLLHLGHAYSAQLAFQSAIANNGRFLLRIEDIDTARSQSKYVHKIYEDLKWLGMTWEEPVLYQSDRMNAYRLALHDLNKRGLIYGCKCTRGDIQFALSARQEGDKFQSAYPGTCRHKDLQGQDLAWRLNIEKALTQVSGLTYHEIGQGRDERIQINPDHLRKIGDLVLARKDIGTSYHLAVTVDDAFQGITHVTRGADMEAETPIHCLLQALLGFKTPIYRHHKLIRDENGKRLAKRHDSLSIQTLRNEGARPRDLLSLKSVI